VWLRAQRQAESFLTILGMQDLEALVFEDEFEG
jgi:hypothetical protein